jgi:hypothetical protein
MFPVLLDRIDVTGAVITADAMHAQRGALRPHRRAWCTLLLSFSWVCQTVQAGRVLPGYAGLAGGLG